MGNAYGVVAVLVVARMTHAEHTFPAPFDSKKGIGPSRRDIIKQIVGRMPESRRRLGIHLYDPNGRRLEVKQARRPLQYSHLSPLDVHFDEVDSSYFPLVHIGVQCGEGNLPRRVVRAAARRKRVVTVPQGVK